MRLHQNSHAILHKGRKNNSKVPKGAQETWNSKCNPVQGEQQKELEGQQSLTSNELRSLCNKTS